MRGLPFRATQADIADVSKAMLLAVCMRFPLPT
jgi:hypothetical protein